MRIATFNCNSVRQRLEQILAWLKQNQPDLLALQETKVVDDDFPAEAFRDIGWQVYYRGEKSYNGVAMVCLRQPQVVDFGLGDDAGESEPRLAHVRLDGLEIVNTYVPQGQDLESEKFRFKLEWFARFRKYLDGKFKPKRDAVLWLGDLNVAPTPADVHDSKKIWPHVCHCQETIDAFTAVTDWGLTDLFRKHLPEPGNFTFWDYRVRGALDRGLGWRIDHFLATPKLAERSLAVTVDVAARRVEKPSDHTFVTLDLAD